MNDQQKTPPDGQNPLKSIADYITNKATYFIAATVLTALGYGAVNYGPGILFQGPGTTETTGTTGTTETTETTETERRLAELEKGAKIYYRKGNADNNSTATCDSEEPATLIGCSCEYDSLSIGKACYSSMIADQKQCRARGVSYDEKLNFEVQAIAICLSVRKAK